MNRLHALIDHLYAQFQRLEAETQQRKVAPLNEVEYPKNKLNKHCGSIVGVIVSAFFAVAVLMSILVIYRRPLTLTHMPISNLTAATAPNFEREYLIEFFNATNGFSWKKNDSWLASDSICYWYGVVCNAENRTVFLSLPRNNLYGTIPATINRLSHLTHLDLSLNLLFGIIPTQLGQIQSLKSIDLGSNKLSGPIPVSLAQLSQLEELNLGSNQLLGSIPPEIGQLANLKSLILAYNQLANTIPVSIGSLTALQWLSVDSNRLGGIIPASIGQLRNLTVLILSNNPFNSGIPSVCQAFKELLLKTAN